MSALLRLGIYRSYRGDLYNITALARHTDTKENLVIYNPLYGDYRTRVGSLKMFQEDIRYQDKSIPRFILIKENPLELVPEK